MTILRDPMIYAKWTGVSQCSADKTLRMVFDEEKGLVELYGGEDDRMLYGMTVEEFIDWTPHKILNKAGVEINAQAGKY